MKKMESAGTLNGFCYRVHVVLVHVNIDVNDEFLLQLGMFGDTNWIDQWILVLIEVN